MFYFLQLGMDQSKTNLPHFPSPPKSIVSLLYLPIHLVGSIVHGKGVEVFFEEGKRFMARELKCFLRRERGGPMIQI